MKDYYEKYNQLMQQTLVKDKEILDLKTELLQTEQQLSLKTIELDNVLKVLDKMGLKEEVEKALGESDDVGASRSLSKKGRSPGKLPILKSPTKDITSEKAGKLKPSSWPEKTREKSKSPERELLDLSKVGELLPWTVVFKQSHPGSLSHLRKQQRDTIQDCCKEFLVLKLGSSDGCVATVKGTEQVAIPEELVDEFLEWFDVKVEEGVLNSTPSATSVKRKTPMVTKLIEGGEIRQWKSY